MELQMEIIQSDITNETSGLIIHGVNCMGRMGSGIALAIKTKWPVVYEKYMEHTQGKDALGSFQPVYISDGLYVGNCWTQEYFGKDGRVYADKHSVFEALVQAFEFCYDHELELKSPQIGCGLGGLDWERDVKPLFNYVNHFFPDVKVKIYYI